MNFKSCIAGNRLHTNGNRLQLLNSQLVLNKKLKNDLKLCITKLASTQIKQDKLKQEDEKIVSSYKATDCVCTFTFLNKNDCKSLETEFENFEKDHYAERMKLLTELSYLKYFFRKLNKGKSDLNIVSLRSDLQNESFENFWEENGIHHNFSIPRTP